MSFTPVLPSASTNGMGIKIAATATAGTLFHTATAGTTQQDEVYMYVQNSDTVSRTVTVEFGDATAPDHNLKQDIAPNTTALVVPGLKLQNGLTVKAFGSAANVLTMTGFINRYAP